MMEIFHDMIEKTMEVFMDDFSVFGNSFQSCLTHLERMLKRCEDTNQCLNWEKSHFMVKEVQHQRKVNLKIHDVIKLEVIKLLEAGLIYPISDSLRVSPVHCVPKNGGFTVVENDDNELIPTRLVTVWRVCIDYRKLNEATQKDHFPLPFMDQMLKRLAGNQYYCTFQRCMMEIFHDMIQKTMEVFMDDFSVFGNSFQSCLTHLERMLKRCEDTNQCLNWEKSHFMVKEVDEPLTVELKDLPPHLEYAFLEGDDKLPIIIAKYLSVEEKTSLINVLKSHKRAIAWKLSDIKGINPEFCTHKILMEEDSEPAVQHQRKVNLKIHDVIKLEVIELLEAGLIYPISDSPRVRPVHCVPKNGGFTVVENDDNELIPTRMVMGWRDMPFELRCDASDFAIRAVLGQHQDKNFRPIHYASKTMTEAKSNYTTTEKEMLAVVYVFEKFRSYLILNKSILYMDHSALKHLFAKKDSKARLL
nr:reverse transcriptase domain-containing protein [Tanacetum cinerariifolium]